MQASLCTFTSILYSFHNVHFLCNRFSFFMHSFFIFPFFYSPFHASFEPFFYLAFFISCHLTFVGKYSGILIKVIFIYIKAYSSKSSGLIHIDKASLIINPIFRHACIVKVRCHWPNFRTTVVVIATRDANTQRKVIWTARREYIPDTPNPRNVIGWIQVRINVLGMANTRHVKSTPLANHSSCVTVLAKRFQKRPEGIFFINLDTKLVVKQFS